MKRPITWCSLSLQSIYFSNFKPQIPLHSMSVTSTSSFVLHQFKSCLVEADILYNFIFQWKIKMVSPESSVDEDRYLETFDELSQSLTYTRSKSVDPSLNSVDSRSGLCKRREWETMERLMNNIRLNLHPSAPAETWVSKLEKAAEVWSESSKKAF
ncbi:hypothetical protein EB796_006371 [Bugula neritina]|uniref:Uncharacterized protein n=1 Tax=Bugula neritina TaxID=10212 RepID=A0A7J7K9J7_BUGNE|nr:hypothetical protein EB796_006371 [Bugula neritina]